MSTSRNDFLHLSINWASLYDNLITPVVDYFSTASPITWHKPPPGWIALNSDGAVSTSSSIGSIGGLLRDDQGNWLGGFTKPHGITKFSQAELLLKREQERVELLLQSLPDSYDQIIINLTNSNVTSLPDSKSAQEKGRKTSKFATSRSVDNDEREINRTWPKQQSQTCGALVVMKGEKISKNLYMLKGETLLEEEASVASYSSDSTMLWHQKLGHMSEQGMKVLMEQNLLPGLTKEMLVYPIKKKSDVFSTFKNFKAHVELDLEIRSSISEYIMEENTQVKNLITFLGKNASKDSSQWRTLLKKWSGRADEQNLVRKNKSNIESCMPRKIVSGRSSQYHCSLVNRTPSTTIKLKTPMEMWTVGSKIQDADGVRGYRLWDPTARKVIISRDAIFVEDKLQRKEEMIALKSQGLHKYMWKMSLNKEILLKQNQHMMNMNQRVLKLNNSSIRSYASLWIMEMQEEIEALHKNNTWDLVPLPYERKPIGNKWVFKIKRNGDDQVERYRARLVVKGYAQKEGPNKDHIEELKAQLAKEFEMNDLVSAKKILGMQIHRNKSNRKIWLSQKNYLKKILSIFNMQDCKSISTTLPINFKLSSSMSPSSKEERMWMFSTVCISSGKFNVRYDMHKTRHCTRSGSGDLDKSKSTTGYVFKVAGGVVSCVSKLQSVVATSTTEAEYVAATQASKEAI
ncbi:hypothetical protein F3Y22_tig00110271pilonHSYRG00204 [Hibiscus syriacus]|uniref:Reverse transcriptase Ty1/copia-type domain-containing protein n=1 Tax=Hibiscus syriacus TaxID=106335 RepID=A0A6A3B489_HIBSY|nr:hypothetical protein F3Y22_tig00110271pilonHSYRG00204 [Hibiscus syriacus]